MPFYTIKFKFRKSLRKNFEVNEVLEDGSFVLRAVFWWDFLKKNPTKN